MLVFIHSFIQQCHSHSDISDLRRPKSGRRPGRPSKRDRGLGDSACVPGLTVREQLALRRAREDSGGEVPLKIDLDAGTKVETPEEEEEEEEETGPSSLPLDLSRKPNGGQEKTEGD